MSNIFMEDLEEKAIETAPAECGLSLWKRYVDDIMEKIKRNTGDRLTQHLNTIDGTGNIKFTKEGMTENKLPFLDIKVMVNEDGSIRLQIYRKSTHTDQYLMFDSHHPLPHKLSVVRTLITRKNEIVTDEEDKKAEEEHIKKVLKICKYPDWAIQKVEKQLAEKAEGVVSKPKKNPDQKKHRGRVTVPYVGGITERINRTMQKHGIDTPVRPHITLRNMMVHPKDQIPQEDKCNVVYKVPCLSCAQVYVGETGRKLSIRIKEHKDETTKVNNIRKTRSTSIAEDNTQLKSAISEHTRTHNHIMDWDNVSVIDRDSEKIPRWIREAMHVRKLGEGIAMNRDEGGYELSHVWDPLLRNKRQHHPSRSRARQRHS